MVNQTTVKTLSNVVVRFSGDSGDGMQLAGNIFTNISAGLGNRVSTFPDYPAEVRAPQGSLSGVSGFQVCVGVDAYTPGDMCDVLIAMNPAALKQNIRFLKPGGVCIVDIDSFKKSDLDKAQFVTDDPFTELNIKAQIVEAPVTSMTKAALSDSGLDNDDDRVLLPDGNGGMMEMRLSDTDLMAAYAAAVAPEFTASL